MKSVWQKDTKIDANKKLIGTHRCDVVVIGAGMAGLLCAYTLSRQHFQVIVVEANEIGSGQSGKTTAKITAQHGLIYHKLLMQCGQEKAQQYLDANLCAVKQYEKLIAEEQIDCDFKKCSSYLYSMNSLNDLQNEQQALEVLGLQTSLQLSFEKEAELPLQIKGALKMENQAQFHPLKFMKALAEKLCVYEHSQIIKIKDNEVISSQGKVEAKHIVFATHYPIIDFPGFYFMRMHQERSYVLALKNACCLQDMYYCIDEDTLSLRCDNDLLLLGGQNHRCGENSEGECYAKLKQTAKTMYPNCETITQWSAQDCMSLDYIPYIGKYSEIKDNWYVITGFNKWGMSSSMVAAQIIKDMIMQQPCDYANVFSPQRFNINASVLPLWEQMRQSMKSITREYLTIPEDTLQHLPIGHGGVINLQNGKAGVYKDEQGRCHIVDVKCPHLGCQLEWNPDELSWDCPCHGSRFDYTGKLIDNPAQDDLYEKE